MFHWGQVMQVSVEKVNNIERRLTISVPAATVEEAYAKQIKEFAKTLKIDGFRQGKVPMSFVEKNFSDRVRLDALSTLMRSAFSEALASHNLMPINTPNIEPKQPAAASEPFEFVATFEVLPEIENVTFTAEKLQKLKVDILSDDVDRVVEQLRKQYTKWKLVERVAEDKDRIVIDYYAIFEGVADTENKIQNYPIELGSKVMLPGFEEGLLGAKAGDERTLNLTFPTDFAVSERAGKPIEFVVQVKQVYEADMPALDEAFIQQLGVKSGDLSDLQSQIRQSLEQERDRLVKDNLKEQIFSLLLEQNPLQVPQTLIDREAKNIHDEMYQNKAHNHDHHSEDELKAFSEVASKRVSLGLIVAEYAKAAAIKADKARVTARISEIASAYENPAEVVEWLSAGERRGNIEAQVMEDQVLEKLMEGISIEEKVMPYADLKGIRA